MILQGQLHELNTSPLQQLLALQPNYTILYTENPYIMNNYTKPDSYMVLASAQELHVPIYNVAPLLGDIKTNQNNNIHNNKIRAF